MSTQRPVSTLCLPHELNFFVGGSEAWAITHEAWSRDDILVDRPGKALWICGTSFPAGTTCQVSALESEVQAPTEGVSKRFLATLNGHARHPRGFAQVLPAPTSVPDHSPHVPWPVPPYNLSLQNDMSGTLGSAYLHLSTHGLSCISSGSVHCCPCSIFCDSRCTANLIAQCGKVFAHRTAAVGRMSLHASSAHSTRAPHSACTMSRFAPCEFGRLNAPGWQVTRRIHVHFSAAVCAHVLIISSFPTRSIHSPTSSITLISYL